MKSPKVSVLIPAYNAEKYIDEAIQSIVDQTFIDWELIVINDGSKDETLDKLREWERKDSRIIVLNNEVNLKLCKTLNRGILECKGGYIARMDADDISIKDRLEKQVNFLDQNKEVGIVGGGMYVCDENMNIKNIRSYRGGDKEIRKILFRYSPFCHPAVMIRKSILEEVGGYDEKMAPTEDIDLWFRLAKITKLANLQDVILKYRVLPTSESQSKARLQEMKTLYTRLKAVFEYGYKISKTDTWYNIAQFLSMFIIPQKFKFWIFNFLRK